MSKGTKQRPIKVPQKQFDENWKRIFGRAIDSIDTDTKGVVSGFTTHKGVDTPYYKKLMELSEH